MSHTLTRDQAIGLDSDSGEYIPLDAESLRDVDLEAKIDGKTPLEVCLEEFNLAALEEPDCIVHGMFELHESVIVLLESGAVVTAIAKNQLEELRTTSNMIKMIRRHDPHAYEACWGAEAEADAVLACAKKNDVRLNDGNTERRGEKRKTTQTAAAGANSSEADGSASHKAQKA